MIHNITFIILLLSLSLSIFGSDKGESLSHAKTVKQILNLGNKEPDSKSSMKEMSTKSTAIKKETMKMADMTKKTTMTKDNTTSEDKIFQIDYKLTEPMKKLIMKKNNLLDALVEADAKMNTLIMQSQKWDMERNKNKKGQLDSIIDKAERLAVSNELRAKLSEQAKTISKYIKDITLNGKMIEDQKVTDEQKFRMDASIALIKTLEDKRIELERNIKNLAIAKQEMGDKAMSHETKGSLKVSKYLKITTKITLREIAFNELFDEEKWMLIYMHSENRAFLKEKSPTAIVPIGVELAIPTIEEE